jgi:hypothetical protein
VPVIPAGLKKNNGKAIVGPAATFEQVVITQTSREEEDGRAEVR